MSPEEVEEIAFLIIVGQMKKNAKAVKRNAREKPSYARIKEVDQTKDSDNGQQHHRSSQKSGGNPDQRHSANEPCNEVEHVASMSRLIFSSKKK